MKRLSVLTAAILGLPIVSHAADSISASLDASIQTTPAVQSSNAIDLAATQAGPAQTQTAASPSTAPKTVSSPLPTLVVEGTTNSTTAPEISAIAKTTITSSEMIKYGDNSVSDALRRAAGIQLGRTGGAGRAKFRGSSDAPTILINGEPVQGGKRAATGLIDTFTPEMIDRIEVTKQPSVTQGAVASGGIINIILKNPKAGQHNTVAKLGAGEMTKDHQKTQNTQAMFNNDGKTKQFGYTVSAAMMDNKGHSENTITRIDPVNPQRNVTDFVQAQDTKQSFKMLAPRFDYTFNERTKGFAEIFYSEHQNDTTNDTTQITSHNQNDSIRLNLRLEHTDGNRSDKWRLGGQLQTEDNWNGNDKGATQTDSAGNSKPVLEHDKTRDMSAAYNGSLKISRNHLVKFGVEGYQTTIDSNQAASLTERRTDAFAEENWKIDEHQTLTAGLRYDGLRRSGLVNFDTNFLSPALAYRYQFDRHWSLQGSLSQTQRAPRPDDLSPIVTQPVASDAGSLNNPYLTGNPNLHPEKIRAAEMVLGYNSPDGGFNLTAFERNIDNYIEKNIILMNGIYYQQPVNQDHAKANGIELEGRWAFKRTRTHSVSLTGQVSTIRVEIEDLNGGTRRASGVAPYTASVGLVYQYMPLRWTTSLNLGYTPTYTTPVNNQPYVQYTRQQTSLDLSTTRRFTGDWAVTFSARNVLGTAYDDEVYSPTSTYYQKRVTNNLPRLLLTVEKRF